MKYEMIFGDEKLFDGAHECATHATKGGGFYFIDTGVVKFISNIGFGAMDVCELTGYLVAERRIIKEPKRWTWEDKKAGRLPEVGSIVKFVKSEIEFLGVGEISNYWVCRYPSGVLAFRERGSIEPIETPAEKAQREEDAFVDVIVSEYNKMPSSISFKAGIRAAYRKLKGGE